MVIGSPSVSHGTLSHQWEAGSCNGSSSARGAGLPEIPPDDSLSAKRHVTLILRVLLDRHGRVDHGEMLEADGNPVARFLGSEGLVRTIRAWLSGQEPNPPSE
jgi:hypothetical protein